jgi:hypothetical protein
MNSGLPNAHRKLPVAEKLLIKSCCSKQADAIAYIFSSFYRIGRNA